MKQYKLYFSNYYFLWDGQYRHPVLPIAIDKMFKIAPKNARAYSDIKYKGQNDYLLARTYLVKDQLVTLEKSITDPHYQFKGGHFKWESHSAIFDEMINLGIRWDVSDLNVWIPHLNELFNKALCPRSENNNPF